MSDDFEDDDVDGASPDDRDGAHPAPDEREDGYRVGYRKPPRHSQFQPGQSGNPRGRKKGSRGLKTDLHAELNRVVEVKMGSYHFRGTTQQLMLRGLALLSANGNLKASAQLLPLILQVFGTEDRGNDKRTLSPHDQAVLDSFLSAFGGSVSDASDAGDSDTSVGAGEPQPDSDDVDNNGNNRGGPQRAAAAEGEPEGDPL